MRSVIVHLLSCVWLFVTPRTAASQASLSFTIFQNLLKFMSIESLMLSNHLTLCRLLPKGLSRGVMATLRTMSLCNLEKDGEHHPCCSMQKKEFCWWNTGGLFQRSLTFVAPGTCFVEDNFSTDGSCASGWFQDDSKAFSLVQSLSRVRLFSTLWIAARQASLSITNSRSSLRLMSIESVMPSSHLILCRPLLLLPPIPPSIRVFSNESTLRMRWPEYCSFSFSISPSNEHPGLISFRMD